jgi:hypothetical protein
LKGDGKEPLKDRATKMVLAFKDEFGVPIESIEKRLGHRLDALSEQELVGLRKIYTSLRDNMAKREDYFPDMANPVENAKPKQPDMGKSAPVTPSTPPAAQQTNTPAQSTPAPSKEEAPPVGKDALYDTDKPVESLASMMKRDSLTEHQVVEYTKVLGLASKSVKKSSEIREANIRKLCESWAQHLDKIKAIPAGE